jgi:hypothetical protein
MISEIIVNTVNTIDDNIRMHCTESVFSRKNILSPFMIANLKRRAAGRIMPMMAMMSK